MYEDPRMGTIVQSLDNILIDGLNNIYEVLTKKHKSE
jgi:hypothetical protein